MDPVQQQPVQLNTIQPEPQKSPVDNILKITLALLIIISIGLGGFILFSMNKNKILPTTTTKISPTPVVNSEQISPTISVIETNDPNNIDVGSVEADLKDIGTEVKNLQ
ncbi:MAG: hypothetical protein WC894_02050 [Patescibacteria group bacterium]